MSTKNLSNSMSIQIGIDSSKLTSYTQTIQKTLNEMSKSLLITPTVNWESLSLLKAELNNLEKAQIVKLVVDESQAIASVNKIGIEMASNFSSAFSKVAGDNMMASIASSMTQVSTASQQTKIAAKEAQKILLELGVTAETDVSQGTSKLATSLQKLAKAFGLFTSGSDSLNELGASAKNAKAIIDTLKGEMDSANPLSLKAQLDIKQTISNIESQRPDLQSALDAKSKLVLAIKAKPVLATDEKGRIQPIKVPATLDVEQTKAAIKKVFDSFNTTEEAGGIKVKIDTADLKKQLNTGVNVKLNFGDSKEKLEEIKKSLGELKEAAKSVSEVKILDSDTSKTSKPKSDAADKNLINTATTNAGNELLAIYKLLQTAVENIGKTKQQISKTDENALELQNKKTAATKEDAYALGQNLKIAQKIQSSYISSLRDQSKFSAHPESRNYEIASQIVREKEAEYNAQFKTLKLRDADRAVLEKTLALEKQSIANKARMAEAHKADSFAKNYEEIQKASNKLLGLESSLATKGKTSGIIDSSKFADAINQLNTAKELAKKISDQLQRGDTSGYSEKYAALSAMVEKLKIYNDEVTQINKKPVMDSKEIDKINKLGSELTSYMNKYGAEIKKNTELYTRFIALQNKLSSKSIGSVQGRSELATLQFDARNLGLEIDSVWKKLQRTFGSRLRSLIAGQGWFLITSSLREVYSNVVQIDTAMTELKKVTNETETGYIRFLDNAAVRAKNLGATLTEVINSSADFARLGYSIPEASELSDSALIYLNVGDDVENIDQATKSIISTMQGFNVEAKNSISIVDKFNKVGNEFATSSGDIGEGMLRSASALDAANNSLDESIALFTAGQEVVQNAESMGTVLKTTSMRIRGATTDLEEAGLDTEGMASSVSKLRDELMSLTGGFDIMENGGDTFKSTYDILKGISNVWSDLTDVSQANILEMLAGKRNGNALAAILNNFETAENVLKASQNSTGSAIKENEIYLNSIQGHLDKMTATWQSLSTTMLDTSAVKGTISTFTETLNIIDLIIDRIGVLPMVIGAATTALYKFGKAGKDCALLPQAA